MVYKLNLHMKRPLPKGSIFYSEKAEKVFDGLRFDVYQWKQKQFDGSEHTFETVRRTDNVFVIPVIGEQVVAVQEEQPHWGRSELNIVAGMLEEGEGILEGAKRELEEETGMIFKNFYLVHMEQPNISAEWVSYTVVATGFTGEEKEQKLDKGEKSSKVLMSFKEYIQTVRNFGFMYRQRFAEDYIIMDKVEEFFSILRNPAEYALPTTREE